MPPGTTAPSSSVQAQPSQAQQAAEKVFQNDFLKVTVKSLKKTGSTINVVFVYENITEKAYGFFLWSDNTYLIDENGERWDYKENPAISVQGRVTTFVPKTKVIAKFTFITKGSTEGKVFSYYSYSNYEGVGSFQITMNDIYAE